LQPVRLRPIQFTEADHGLYDRHLLFDNVMPLMPPGRASGSRRSPARCAMSSRSGGCAPSRLTTERIPKRVYYLSMEFLIGRSLDNNVINLLLEPVARHAAALRGIDRMEMLEQEPDAAWATAARTPRRVLPRLDGDDAASGDGLRPALRVRHLPPDNRRRLAARAARQLAASARPWEVARVHEAVEIPLACSIELRNGSLHAVPGRPSTLIGIPFDRPIVGYGGKTINTLRLWAAAAPDYFDFQRFSSGDFVGALAETLGAESLTRVLYPDDSTSMGKRLRFVQEYFLVACSLADLVRRFRRGNATGRAAEKVAIQLNDTHPRWPVPELMRILLDDAKLGWDQAWELTQRRSLTRITRSSRSAGEVAAGLVRADHSRAICRSSTRSTGGS
jgi:starch phosphorylase